MLGKSEGRRRRGRQKMRWLDGIRDSMDMSLVSGPEGSRMPQGSSACVPQLLSLRSRARASQQGKPLQ